MNCFKRFVKNATGNVAMLFGLAAVPLVLGAGVALDMVRINATRTILQGAADAAALAGATSKDKSDAALQKMVVDYLTANNAQAALESVTKISQLNDLSNGTFTVEISGTIPASLMELAGFDKLGVSAKSVVNVGSQSLELALVLDNTGSMAGTKIANLKAAATNLVNIISSEASDFADVKMAVVPFAEYVNVGVGNSGQAWIDTSTTGGAPWTGCVGSRPAPLDLAAGTVGGDYPALAGVPCNTVLQPLTSDLLRVKTTIGAMVATGWTYIPTGLLWGWNVLDSAAPFTEGKSPAETSRTNGKKAMVLMTDGENTISPSYPAHDAHDVALANANLESMCEKVKGDGIEIFTVSFMVPSVTIKDILSNCASVPENYFDADNGPQLNAAFADIARELAAVRFTQ